MDPPCPQKPNLMRAEPRPRSKRALFPLFTWQAGRDIWPQWRRNGRLPPADPVQAAPLIIKIKLLSSILYYVSININMKNFISNYFGRFFQGINEN